MAACRNRPECGGATVCAVCLRQGLSRADQKLLRSEVAVGSLEDMVRTVWPEAHRNEVLYVTQALLKRGVALPKPGGAKLEHRLWPLLRSISETASDPVDPLVAATSRGASWAVPLITPARLAEAGLHVFSKHRSSRVLVRRKTALNAIDSATLAKALRARGVRGTPLEDVYEEYETAFTDVFRLAKAGKVTVDENMVWHAANVPAPIPGALLAWQRALAGYKPQ